MFTGIVQGMGEVVQKEVCGDVIRLGVSVSDTIVRDIVHGASVAINGICLTVVGVEDCTFLFEVTQETLAITSLKDIEVGGFVNVERSVRFGDEIGGHIMSGHVDGVCTVVDRIEQDGSAEIVFSVPEALMKYVLSKGFVGLNGVSLTVVDPDYEKSIFRVAFIPETLEVTVFGSIKVGDIVNLEVDRMTQAIVDTVERIART